MFNNYINLFSGVAFLYQRFWNTGKKNYLFNGRANPNEDTSKIKKKKKSLYREGGQKTQKPSGQIFSFRRQETVFGNLLQSPKLCLPFIR